MINTSSLTRHPLPHFALALVKGSFNDLRLLATSLFTPLLLLLMFWFLTRDFAYAKSGEKGAQLMAFMFPGIVGFTVMQSGQLLALRIVNWRQQGVFQRLACTPVPLGQLVLGTALAQTLMAMAQGSFILLFGVLMLRLPVNAAGAVLSVFALTLGSACFIALGAVVSTFTAKSETASTAFIFILLPLYFLGGGLPPEVLPEFLRNISPWLPTTLLTNLLNHLLANGQLPTESIQAIAGLLAYTAVFVLIAARNFRWE